MATNDRPGGGGVVVREISALTSGSWGMRFERIPEENQEINLVVDNLGTNLLVAARGSTGKTLSTDGKPSSRSKISPVVPVANTWW